MSQPDISTAPVTDLYTEAFDRCAVPADARDPSDFTFMRVESTTRDGETMRALYPIPHQILIDNEPYSFQGGAAISARARVLHRADVVQTIGERTIVGPMARLAGSFVVGPGCRVDGSVSDSRLETGTTVMVGAHIRSWSTLGSNSHVGLGATVEASTLGAEAKIGTGGNVAHSTLGDAAEIGDLTNIQSSTIGNRALIGAKTYINAAQIGDRVSIGDGSRVEPSATIEDDVVAEAGVRFDHSSTIGAGTRVLANGHVIYKKRIKPQSVVVGPDVTKIYR